MEPPFEFRAYAWSETFCIRIAPSLLSLWGGDLELIARDLLVVHAHSGAVCVRIHTPGLTEPTLHCPAQLDTDEGRRRAYG